MRASGVLARFGVKSDSFSLSREDPNLWCSSIDPKKSGAVNSALAPDQNPPLWRYRVLEEGIFSNN